MRALVNTRRELPQASTAGPGDRAQQNISHSNKAHLKSFMQKITYSLVMFFFQRTICLKNPGWAAGFSATLLTSNQPDTFIMSSSKRIHAVGFSGRESSVIKWLSSSPSNQGPPCRNPASPEKATQTQGKHLTSEIVLSLSMATAAAPPTT